MHRNALHSPGTIQKCALHKDTFQSGYGGLLSKKFSINDCLFFGCWNIYYFVTLHQLAVLRELLDLNYENIIFIIIGGNFKGPYLKKGTTFIRLARKYRWTAFRYYKAQATCLVVLIAELNNLVENQFTSDLYSTD